MIIAFQDGPGLAFARAVTGRLEPEIESNVKS